MQQSTTLRLTLDIDYVLNGETTSSMKSLLESGLASAIGNSLLSGHTEAEVLSHSYTILEFEPSAPKTEADKIHNAISYLIKMSRSHIEDIDLGLTDGMYDAADNKDIEDKRAAMDLVYDQQERIKACLNVCEAKHPLKATENDAVGRRGAELVQFVEQIAKLQKWGDGKDENEMNDPSDGTEDSHACLMDLIDQARDILAEKTQLLD